MSDTAARRLADVSGSGRGDGLAEPVSGLDESTKEALDLGEGFPILPEASQFLEPEVDEVHRAIEIGIEREALAVLELLRHEGLDDFLSRQFAGE